MKKFISDIYWFIIWMFLLGIFIFLIIIRNALDLLVIKIVYYCAYCLMLSSVHEIGHYIVAKLCCIPIYKVGFGFYKFFPRAYIKVDLKNISTKAVILFYMGGVLSTFILIIIIVLNIMLFKYRVFDLLFISAISIVINMLPLYKSDGYYIMKIMYIKKIL